MIKQEEIRRRLIEINCYWYPSCGSRRKNGCFNHKPICEVALRAKGMAKLLEELVQR